jgi:tyrosyl-tRNA synthetase
VSSGPSPAEQLDFLARNVAEVIPREELASKLERGRPLRVKLGLDPTAADVTLGWAVVLRKLREFQDLGHTAVLIVGDFTARVGDPSGKSETRPRLEKEVVQANAERVLTQFHKILSEERLEIRYNSEWLEGMSMEDVLRMTSLYTVARMLERDDFAKRFGKKRPISIMEFMYPLLQAMDSVNVQADVELGGSDQKFNLLVGREIQKDYGQEQQVAFTMPLLIGLDGSRIMGQSLGNYVGINEPADDMFGKLMSIPDELIVQYLSLCTSISKEDVEATKSGLADGSRHPNQEKRRMARQVVDLYHGQAAGEEAEQRFDQVHKRRELPDDIPGVFVSASNIFIQKKPGVWLLSYPALLVELGLAKTRSEARRLIEQGGVRRNGARFALVEEQFTVPPDQLVGTTPETVDGVWQAGTRRFARVEGLG